MGLIALGEGEEWSIKMRFGQMSGMWWQSQHRIEKVGFKVLSLVWDILCWVTCEDKQKFLSVR